jgi:MtN3 and saliva related transmembrane protein
VAGVFTALSLLPQLIKLIKTKKAEGISLFYLIILFFGLIFWIWYGILQKDLPIIATNTFSVVTNAFMLVLGIRYKKRGSQH